MCVYSREPALPSHHFSVESRAAMACLSADVPSTRVQLHISCKDLRKADVLSKSDPLTAIYTCDQAGRWNEVVRLV